MLDLIHFNLAIYTGTLKKIKLRSLNLGENAIYYD